MGQDPPLRRQESSTMFADGHDESLVDTLPDIAVEMPASLVPQLWPCNFEGISYEVI